jgi:hypothetical protein
VAEVRAAGVSEVSAGIPISNASDADMALEGRRAGLY